MSRLIEKERFGELFAKGGMEVTDEQYSKLSRYADMLCEWNEKMNLTNIVDDQGIAIRHFIDSLTLVAHSEEEERKLGRQDLNLIDVGTGAGFPGIPLKVTMPNLNVTLLDSLKKRVGFLDAVCEALQLTGITTIHSRAEEAAKNKQYREKFDIATARAVAALPTLCEYCLPYVKVGGIFLAMKGHAEDEIDQAKKAIVTLGGTLEDVHEFLLPGTDMQRTILVIRKIRATPARFWPKSSITASDPSAQTAIGSRTFFSTIGSSTIGSIAPPGASTATAGPNPVKPTLFQPGTSSRAS